MSDFEPIKEHFRRLLDEHEDSAKACSWGSEDVARRNFAALAQLFAHETAPFTVYEVGCGLGTMSEFLAEHFPLARYSGSDILPEMIARAKERDPALDVDVRDILVDPPVQQYDYVVVCGLFNEKFSNAELAWSEFVKNMSRRAFGLARKGYGAVFLTSYVDWKRDMAWHQDPGAIFDFAQRELARFIEIRHSYYPWEFALFVYHQPKALPCGPDPATVPVTPPIK